MGHLRWAAALSFALVTVLSLPAGVSAGADLWAVRIQAGSDVTFSSGSGEPGSIVSAVFDSGGASFAVSSPAKTTFTLVPEPSTLLPLAAGLARVMVARWRRPSENR